MYVYTYLRTDIYRVYDVGRMPLIFLYAGFGISMAQQVFAFMIIDIYLMHTILLIYMRMPILSLYCWPFATAYS